MVRGDAASIWGRVAEVDPASRLAGRLRRCLGVVLRAQNYTQEVYEALLALEGQEEQGGPAGFRFRSSESGSRLMKSCGGEASL